VRRIVRRFGRAVRCRIRGESRRARALAPAKQQHDDEGETARGGGERNGDRDLPTTQ
jgi:hypothetical protein